MQEFDFLQAQSIKELLDLLNESEVRILAGGTDVIPKMRNDLFSASALVDVSQLDDLRIIDERDSKIFIGALTTHQEIANSALLHAENPALVVAAGTVGCVQTRNRGTLGGNIANASPAADAVPPLLVYDAQIHLMSKSGKRVMPLSEFATGPGATKIASDEFIHSVSFTKLGGAWGSAFQKMGKRSGMAIAVVSAAAAVVLDEDGNVEDARIALGSVAPTVVRCPVAESMLIGQEPTSENVHQAAQACAQEISPIGDVRSTAEYRNHAAVVLAGRAIDQAISQAKEKFE